MVNPLPKVGIYSPYLDTAGGGEKYMLTIASVLSLDHQVEILLDDKLFEIGWDEIRKKNEQRHGLDLSNVVGVRAPIGAGSSMISRLLSLRKYQHLFYNSDGSIFFSTAKNNIVHFQMPFGKTAGFKPWQNFKLSSWKKAIYNSNFTKDYIEKDWSIVGEVIYPPVDTTAIKPKVKKDQILTVGRFDGFTKVKKQQLMIDEFKKLIDGKEIEGWSFHLAGGMLPGDKLYVEELRSSVVGYPIFFHENVAIGDLHQLYGESKIYWHAMGYGEDDPKRIEHFGISTVEAMAGGSVPIVFNKGGQKEIVQNGENGFTWDTIEELESQTIALVKKNSLLKSLSAKAEKSAKRFETQVFAQKILSLLK